MRLLILSLSAALLATTADADPQPSIVKPAAKEAWGCKVDREPAWGVAIRGQADASPTPDPRSVVKDPELYRLEQPAY